GHVELRTEVPRPGRHARGRRPLRLLGGTVLRRVLRRHHHLLHRPRDAAHRVGRGARSDVEPVADQHLAAGPQVRAQLRPPPRGRPLAADHDRRDRRLRVVGTPAGGDQPQARDRLPRALRVRRGDLRLRHARGDPPRAARRLGPRLPVRHHEPPRLGVERGLPVPALPLQPGAHDRRDVLLHDDARAVDARVAHPLDDEPGEGRADEDERARELVLPRRAGLLDRRDRDPSARSLPGPQRRHLERDLYRDLGPALGEGVAGVVELVAQPSHLEL
ncbi:MAG: Photosynthetic reaction center L subunit, partial [uncultured Solirubrobacteraceae bacterium]